VGHLLFDLLKNGKKQNSKNKIRVYVLFELNDRDPAGYDQQAWGACLSEEKLKQKRRRKKKKKSELRRRRRKRNQI
jgi:hypothetical protein